MKRTSSTDRLGMGSWRAVLVALGAVGAIGAPGALAGCGGEEPAARSVGVSRQAVTTTTATVGTSTVNTATQNPHERKAFYAAGRHFVFYSDGTNLVFQSSTDGVVWAAKTTVRAATSGATFGVWFDGTRVHYAYAAATTNTALYYRRGTPNADGTITWTAEATAVAAASSTTYRYPTVTADTAGVPWVGYLRDSSTDYPYVTKATAADGTWTAASGFPHQLSTTSSNTWTAVAVPLQAGRMLAVYGRTTAKPDSKVWTGSAWATARVGITANNVYASGTRLSVVGQGDDAHLVYLKVSAYAVQYVKWTYSAADTTYYGSWGGETAVQAAVSATSAPVAALDGPTGRVYAFWAGSPTANHLYYKKRAAAGTWDVSATDWVNEATELLTGNDRLAAYAQESSRKLGVVYSTKTASPFNVKQATLGLDPPPVCGNGTVEEGEQCETPFAACCNPATCQYRTTAEECRATAGDCDVAEKCTGTSAACPSDGTKTAGTECRPAAGGCDVAEACDGVSTACPADAFVMLGTTCRGAVGPCDVDEACTGTSAACPADLKVAAGTVCRPIGGLCDAAEACDGVSAECPQDGFVAAGTECRGTAGPCDVADACTGTSAACPEDLKVPAGTVCRPASGTCDVGAVCDGAGVACPATGYAAAGTACSDGRFCTVADACNGAGACVGSARDCTASGDGKCLVGSCNDALATCEAVTDPAGDGNACTTDDLCSPMTGVWFAAQNACELPGAFEAKVAADGIALAWELPTTPGLTAVEIYRTEAGVTVAKPGARPEARIYTGLGTTFTDAAAPAGERMVYTAFALYGAGAWSAPATASAQRDDRDGDGMADGWELANGLNPYNPGDAALDPDGDGLSNLQEYLAGTNPGVADTDGDGLTDGEEVARGFNPLSQDTDGDGMSDKFEIGIGLDPQNGHDFAIGNYMYSTNYRLGAYTVDSGQYSVDGAGLPLPRSATRQLVISSKAQHGPIGPQGSANRLAWSGYLYTIEEFVAPNYPPSCNAGMNRAVVLEVPSVPVQLGGTASDPNGDPVSYSWSFIQVPGLSALTTASLVGATTATPSFTPDVYGYYMLQLAVTDVTGTAGAPCYVVITALTDQQYAEQTGEAGQFFFTGPFAMVSATRKVVAYTTDATGGLPAFMTSATRQIGGVVADRGATGPMASATRQADTGYATAAFALYDVTSNLAPVAVAGTDQTIASAVAATLDGSGSYDPDGYPAPLSYQWSLWSKPYGSAATLVNPTSPAATLVPDKAGSYVALLKVYDGEMWSLPDPVVVTVANRTPIANAGPDQYVQLGSPAPTVQLDGAGSADPDGLALTYGWRFFRKPAGSTAVLSSATAVSPTFVADKAGYYHLELVVKDGLLVSAPDYVTISVGSTNGNLPPIAAAGQGQQLVGVNSTGLDGSGSHDPDWDTAAYPDPDPTGVYRKGLQYDWRLVAKPAGSTATITCSPVQFPAWNCPNPVLTFNGFNGTYVVGLTVQDWASPAAISDEALVTVTVSGIQDEPPIAVVTPQHKSIPFSETGLRVMQMDGSASFDPVDAQAALTYTWTIVEPTAAVLATWAPELRPTLTNPSSATPTLAIQREGQYRVHLKVCDAGAKCSCAWGESRTGDAYCNASSIFTLTTTTTTARVAMPAGWPAVGQAGGSGGTMQLFMGEDGAYDKPVIVVNGFSANEAAVRGDTYQPLNGAFAPIVKMLRAKGYDVWWLSFDPVCSGGAVPNPNAGWLTCGQGFAKENACACAWPQQPVDNHVTLNAAVLAYAAKAAKDYGACGGKSADDPTDPCFVRLYGHSMGGLIARTALAFAQDSTQTTVPLAAGESPEFALNGLRTKPTGVTTWDLGVRVSVYGDASLQGGNIPVSLQAFIKNYELRGTDSMASGGPMSDMGFETSGMSNFIAWSFLKNQGVRNWAIAHRDLLENLQQMFEWWNPATEAILGYTFGPMIAGLLQKIGWLNKAGPGLLSYGLSAVSGFLEGMVAGFGWGVLGAVSSVLASWAASYVATTVLKLAAWSGPYFFVVAILSAIFKGFLFSVKTSFDVQTLDDSNQEFVPFKFTPILDSPASKELLYQRVTGYTACPDVPMVLQGYGVANIYKPGFGKETNGRLCRGTPSIQTTSLEHDRFFTYLRGLNGGTGYPTNVRNVGLPFGGRAPGIAADTDAIMDLYLPYVVSNQRYPTYAWDHLPGSGFGPEIMDQLATFKLHMKGVLTIKKRFLFWSSTSRKTLFDDFVKFPEESLGAGAGWPYIPTESSSDYTRPAGCGTNLPCCQLLPDGVTPHPADDGQRNCCQCSTGLDAMIAPSESLLHVPVIAVNPCKRGTSDDAHLEAMRQACVAPSPEEVEGIQKKMCPGDSTVHLYTNPYGYICDPLANEAATRGAVELLAKAVAQLDVRPRCADTQASFVCLDGSASCPPDRGIWVWLGGVDRDGDGCPGPRLRDGTLCATYCETEAQDADATVKGNEPQGNHAPVIASVSAQQSFALPSCWADATTRDYHCVADVKDTAGNALTVSVAAADADGDPLRYQWTFLPDAAAGQSAGDVAFSNALGASPRVIIRTSNKPPQGTYAIRVHVKDNKGGVVYADTAVAVPGDAQPAVAVVGPASVPEICEYEANEFDAWRCYADLTLQGTATDPDGPDQTSIILYRWEDITDRESSAYKAVTAVEDPYLLNPGLEVYASEQHATTVAGYPLRFRLTVVDVRGQQASAEVSVVVCPMEGCQ